jgi:hypothetical protein
LALRAQRGSARKNELRFQNEAAQPQETNPMTTRIHLRPIILTVLAMFAAISTGMAAVCSTCKGSGTGDFKCVHCKGSGSTGTVKCSFCNGKGFVKCGRCGGTGQAK